MRFFLVLLLLLPVFSFADSIELTWDTPVQYEDGSELLPQDIDGYVIKHQIGKEPQPDIKIDGRLTTTHIIPDVSLGVHIFSIATMANGVTGGFSNPIAEPVTEKPKPAPAAPTLIRVQLNCDNCQYEIKE